MSFVPQLRPSAPEVLEVQRRGKSPRRNGNYASDAFPYDACACAGDGQWCAIAIETDQ
jgi:crotonobetainyl-CoA:carnitine CoA-transferase CaiB-like acyl-CoA transferase